MAKKLINNRMKFPKTFKSQEGKYGKTTPEMKKEPLATEVNKNPLTDLSAQNVQMEPTNYVPASESCVSVETVVPRSMRYDMHKAIETVDRRVDGVDEFVAEKLGYVVGDCSIEQRENGLRCLCDAFSAEQVDALAVAIYNIEQKGQGCIIGDQTGIGKGRIAAGMVRYAIKRGLQPIFITEKPNLFSDFFRDLIAIGSDDDIPVRILEGYKEVERKVTKSESEDGDDIEEAEDDDEVETETNFVKIPVYVNNKAYPSFTTEVTDKNGKTKIVTRNGKVFCKPFIVNSRGPKSDIKNEQGHILYTADDTITKQVIGTKVKNKDTKDFQFTQGTGRVPEEFDFILATYSQFRGATTNQKMQFLMNIARGNVVIMDESHNASGSSNTGAFLKGVLKETLGSTFLSATFAKRPDNMPIYASKTSMADANLTDQELVNAIQAGGVALQEIVASALVSEGQMIRRQRSYEGIEVNYEYLDESQSLRGFPQLNKEQEHRAAMDKATDIIREIILFQENYVGPAIAQLDQIAKKEYAQVSGTKAKGVGVDMPPIFSGVFNIINQLLFSIKAESVAENAIIRLKEGKKPVIAFANTMESFLDTLTDDSGELVRDGDLVSSDFSKIFEKRLRGVTRYTVKDERGNNEKRFLVISEQTSGFQAEYKRIMQKIKTASIGISSSPIDVLIDRIEKAGFSVVEVTGRARQLKMQGNGVAMVKNRQIIAANDAYRRFNTNEVDCLLINQSGSTGASAHALPNSKVPPAQVKQRVMEILQAELNINTEVQKRGRINRTGQILLPIYDYVISSIPAERRLMMMLQKKLKSLDANTSSDQGESKNLMDASKADFLNKYGDIVVVEWLKENPLVNKMIGDPLKLGEAKEGEETGPPVDAAHRVSGRVAILSCRDQENFYAEIAERYVNLVQYLMQTGEYDLEVEKMNLAAETVNSMVVVAGKGGESVFGRNSVLEKCLVNNLRKPFTKSEVDNLLKASLAGYKDAEALKASIIERFQRWNTSTLQDKLINEEEYWENLKTETKDEYKASSLGKSLEQRLEEIDDAKETSKEKLRERAKNVHDLIVKLMSWYYVGKVVGYPSLDYKENRNFNKAIFLGFDIKDNVKNPYAPSALKLRFAIAGSQKYVSVPASKLEILDAITSITYQNIFPDEAAYVLENWNEITKEKAGDRTTRYIVTGNILQAYGNPQLKGSLISYTTNTGGVKKGILLPESFSEDAKGDSSELRITVPLLKCLKILKQMNIGTQLTTTDGIEFLSKADQFAIYVPLSKKSGGQFYLDETILKLIEGNKFNSVSGRMVAYIERRKIDNLVNYIQDTFNSNVQLTRLQFEIIKDTIENVVYNDEEKTTQPDVFLNGLKEEDVSEAELRQREEEAAALDSEHQANAMEEAAMAETELRAKKAAVVAKFHKLRRLIQSPSKSFARGGKIPQVSEDERSLYAEARHMGELAYMDGKSRAPAQNKDILDFAIKHGGNVIGGSAEYFKQYIDGWDRMHMIEVRKQFPELYKR